MTTIAVARYAMATRFEILLPGPNEVALRAAGEEALDEIERLESQLSLFRETSEIAHINAHAAAGPVRVSTPVFNLLRRALDLSRATGGAFDITLAPLMRCWGFRDGDGRVPGAEELARARSLVGRDRIELNEGDLTVRLTRPGVKLDLGAIGKGYAIDCAVEALRDAGVVRALIHGGTSTIYGLGAPVDADAWRVVLPRPEFGAAFLKPGAAPPPDQPEAILTTIKLHDESLSVSAVWGRSFEAGGRVYGHVMDPREGAPVDGAVMSAVAGPSATDTDALSTALLVLGIPGIELLSAQDPGLRLLVAEPGTGPGRFRIETRGL